MSANTHKQHIHNFNLLAPYLICLCYLYVIISWYSWYFLLLIFILSKVVLLQHHYTYLCNSFTCMTCPSCSEVELYIFDHIEWWNLEYSFTNWVSQACIVSCILKLIETNQTIKNTHKASNLNKFVSIRT